MRIIAGLLLLLLVTSESFGQGTQCRTSPVGSSTSYCASEAFVTQSTAAAGDVTGPATSTTGHIATFADSTGKVIEDGGVPAGGNVTSSGTPVAGQVAEWNGASHIEGTNLTSFFANGAGISITGTTNPTVAQSLTNATVEATPSNPSTTGSTSGIMLGLGVTGSGGGCRITPVYSGRLKLEIMGNISNNTSGSITSTNLRWGTGTAPAFNAAAAGTVVGNTAQEGVTGATAVVPFSLGGIVTGLTVGTLVWFDLLESVTANTGTISNVSCNAMEF